MWNELHTCKKLYIIWPIFHVKLMEVLYFGWLDIYSGKLLKNKLKSQHWYLLKYVLFTGVNPEGVGIYMDIWGYIGIYRDLYHQNLPYVKNNNWIICAKKREIVWENCILHAHLSVQRIFLTDDSPASNLRLHLILGTSFLHQAPTPMILYGRLGREAKFVTMLVCGMDYSRLAQFM